MLEIRDITVRFGGVVALNGIAATFSRPTSGIIGPNGAGKTTLMNVLSGFVTPTGGSVDCDGQDILRLAPFRRARWGLRRSFQREEIADDLTVFENILVQLDNAPRGAASKSDEVAMMLDYVGLNDRAAKIGSDLNSFERRLTDVAKCLVGQPKVVMFDEPAGGLSVDETRRLGELIKGIHGLTGAQTLVIDHDVDMIQQVCEEALVLDFGKKIAFGPTRDVLADPVVKAAYLGTEDV